MDVVQPQLTVRMFFILILLSLLQMSSGLICSGPPAVEFKENNEVDTVVATITAKPGVTLELMPPSNILFKLSGDKLLAANMFDFETEKRHTALITCTETASGSKLTIRIEVVLVNENDNPPVFDKSLYEVSVSEMSPIGTTVGQFAATDPDKPVKLFYTLTSESQNSFELKSPDTPDLIIKTSLDYETVKNVKLVLNAQDTPLATSDAPSFTATTTIMVTILDGDNRPPWFQPCTRLELGTTVICQSAGYTGSVIINELENQALPLEPGPLYAIDGDAGINEKISYAFLDGKENRFKINANTGSISMLKPVTVLETINLIVLATQSQNTYQFATTNVAISVQVKSLHPPQFQKPQYEGVVSSVGSMVTDGDKLLYIHATDADYNGVPNPYIVYTITGSSDFSIINGYLFMTKELPATTYSLQVVATDESNGQSDTATLIVQVKSGLTTPPPTTDSSTATPSTTASSMSSTHPSTSTPTEGTVSTTKSTVNTEGSISTASTAHPPTGPTTDSSAATPSTTASSTATPSNTASTISSTPPIIPVPGSDGQADTIALGVTLGVLLLVCLVVIGVLSYRMRKGKADWKKIFEVSLFRSSLGQSSGGLKQGVQYTNEAFQNDEDGGSTGSSGPEGGVSTEAFVKSSLPLHMLLPDDTNEAGLDTAENEKEVKPILTKERRNEEGYKAVWFKEDIDPNAKEEVVIIPDRREDDSDEEDEPVNKTPKVKFDDTDLDSGLGVKMGDQPEDSDGDEGMTSNL